MGRPSKNHVYHSLPPSLTLSLSVCLSLSLSFSLSLSPPPSLFLSRSPSLLVCLCVNCIMTNILINTSFNTLAGSVVAAASRTAPDTTPKVTQLDTRFPLFSVLKERKKKTKTCSFFLELRSVGASLVKTIKQNEQTKKSTSSPVTQAAIVRNCSVSNCGPAGLAPFRTLTQFMQVIY